MSKRDAAEAAPEVPPAKRANYGDPDGLCKKISINSLFTIIHG
jgi:hypothetical protein